MRNDFFLIWIRNGNDIWIDKMTGFPLPVGSMPTVGYGCWKLGKDKAADIGGQ